MTRAQADAIERLARTHGEPTYVNAFRPAVAVWADFRPSETHPAGSSWRITPDGRAADKTEALLHQGEA